MLAQTKIDHLEFGIGSARRKQKVFQLQIAVDDPLGVEVPHRTEHLLDQSRALRLGVVVIGLLVQAVKELSPQTQFLDQVDFRVALVDLFQSHNIGVVQLAHDEDFLAQLFQSLLGLDPLEVERLDGVFHSRLLVAHLSDDSRDARPQYRPTVDPVVDLLDGPAKGNLDVDHLGCQGRDVLVVEHVFEVDGGSGVLVFVQFVLWFQTPTARAARRRGRLVVLGLASVLAIAAGVSRPAEVSRARVGCGSPRGVAQKAPPFVVASPAAAAAAR
mmetsp:Transcript_1593/g.3420  ORF Transcript_1593/g.3420 Transcript_1593/m.3420 type:complete len:272 (-) Transcript_1593:380-1195(-)